MSAVNRAKLAVALLGDPDVYSNVVPGQAGQPSEFTAKEMASMEELLNKRKPEEMKPVVPVMSMQPMKAPMQSAPLMAGAPRQPSKQNHQAPMQPMPPMQPMQSDRGSTHGSKPGPQSVQPFMPSNSGPARSNHQAAPRINNAAPVDKTNPNWCAADQKTWAERGAAKSVGNGLPALRDVQDSITDIAGGPDDKVISGTKDSDYMAFVNHDDSDIGEVLAQAIDNLNATAFALPFSVSVAFPGIQDTPLIGISQGFLDLSGYSREEIVGQNCRLLLKGVPKNEISQDVRQEARRYCKAAHLKGLTKMAHTLLLQRNCRKNGELFWNLFMMSTIPGPNSRNYVIGLQLDLGPTLPEMADRANMESMFFKDHRENLIQVQSAMFGNKPKGGPGQADDDDDGLGLAEDINSWLMAASKRAGSYQREGTLPWVAWPTSRGHALMNGGASLLRLEADRVKTGAVAMSVFPVAEKPDMRSFKVQVDDVCPIWGVDVNKGAVLPMMGFTLLSPSQMDEIGGLPHDIRKIPESVIFTGDGGALSVAPDHEGMGDAVQQYASKKSIPHYPYKIQNGDIIECTWGKNWLKVEAQGKLIHEVRDMVIFPPSHEPAFAVFDLSGAVCKCTLLV
jgi:hypothetical protein